MFVINLENLTFTQDIYGVTLTELQVLWALSSIVIQRHHLVEDGATNQGIFPLKKQQNNEGELVKL